MYHLAKLKWVIDRDGGVSMVPTIYIIDKYNRKPIELEELHIQYDVLNTFEKNGDVYFILESAQQIEDHL